jgi:hypothetical protein
VEIAKSLEGIELGARPDPELVERQCNSLDEKLYAVLADLADPAVIERLHRQFHAEIGRRRPRPNEQQMRIAEKQFLQKQLLAEFELPRFSLYYIASHSDRKAVKEKNPKRQYASTVESGFLFSEQL